MNIKPKVETKKQNRELKTKIKKFNEHFNIIKIYKDDMIDFYLEKIGYGDLYFIVGTQNDTELTNHYIYMAIGRAEQNEFWGEE